MKLANMSAVVLALVALATGANAQHEQHGNSEHVANPSTVEDTNMSKAGPHGGVLKLLETVQLETVVEPGGLRLFVYDLTGRPVDVRNSRGLAILQIKGDAKRYRYDLFPEIGKNKSAESLAVAVDLSQIGGRQVDLNWQLVGITGAERRPMKFAVSSMVPMTAAQQVATAIAKQKVCPVSGHPLGSMGKALPVTIGDKTVYVCCAGCIDTVKSDPAKYFGQKPELVVTKATQADQAAIERQKLCPVMDEPLGSMGTPLKVTGLGRDIFLCCKGCLKFLEKEPEKYLAKLSVLPGSAVAKATQADAQYVAIQKVCPVMDEPLDAMGGPYKTVVDSRVVYLCCPGCAKKLHANPAAYLQKLAGQGVTPPLVR